MKAFCLFKNKDTLFSLSMALLSGSLIMKQFVPHTAVSGFFQGLMMGLSIGFMIVYLLKSGKLLKANGGAGK